jgi:Tfp pilus assembly protein FimV
MSVATELIPTVTIPDRARHHALPEFPAQLATVTVLRPPSDVFAAPPLRLTRRGVVALALAVFALGVGLVWLGRLGAAGTPAPVHAPRAVTVQPGDTLWSIASRVAPQRDPRAEVQALQQRNRLTGADLLPGQVLRVP